MLYHEKDIALEMGMTLAQYCYYLRVGAYPRPTHKFGNRYYYSENDREQIVNTPRPRLRKISKKTGVE